MTDDVAVKPTESVNNVTISRFTRSDLADNIQRYWCHEHGYKSPYVIHYLSFRSGVVYVHHDAYTHVDLLFFRFESFGVAFVDANGAIRLQPFHDVVPTTDDTDAIRQFVERHCAAEKEYMDREQRFLSEKPWLHVHRLSAPDAVVRLTQLGWGVSK